MHFLCNYCMMDYMFGQVLTLLQSWHSFGMSLHLKPSNLSGKQEPIREPSRGGPTKMVVQLPLLLHW